LDACRRLKAILPATQLLYLTMNRDTDIVDEAFRIGAIAYLLKTCEGLHLPSAI